MKVRDIMCSPLVAVAADTPLKDVARLLVEQHVTGVPVLDGGRVIGVVSQTDIVGVQQTSEPVPPRQRLRQRVRVRPEPQPRRHARDVMSSPALLVQAQTSATGAAHLMTSGRVNRLVVVDRGIPVGMVTRTDLVRAFVRADAAIREEIVREILPSLDISPNTVSVTVDAGEVSLHGEVDAEFQARHLKNAVLRVIGVVSVESDVAARTAA